jgi:IS1 family transposase
LAQKKVSGLPKLSETLVAVERPVLELDELWSFVLKKAHKRWVWPALCRQTRQVVAYVVGDRSAKTCRRLWEAVPEVLRRAHCYRDFRDAYSKVLRPEQHSAVGKESGETAHIERWNLTLRRRLARFVRRTLSFSKSSAMHEACLRLFIHRYNCSHALTLM